MPITTSAKKALRSSIKKREFNLRVKNNLQTSIKNLKKLVSTKKAKEAREYLSQVQKAIDKAVKTGYIKKNAGSRKKSRLAALIKKAN